MPVIGLLQSASLDSFAHFMRAFRQGLKDSGYGRARMWRSITAGRRANTIDCPHWQTELVRRQSP